MSSNKIMITFRHFAIAMLCGLFASSAFSQTPQQLTFWKKAVAEKPLIEIANLLSAGSAPAWPKAGSIHALDSLSAENHVLAQDALALVRALHAKAQREFSRTGPGTIAETRGYSTLASALEKAGGYSNLLLADSFRRLVAFRFSEALVRGTWPTGDVRRELERTTVPHVEVRTMLEELATDDPAVTGKNAELEKIKPDQSVFAALDVAGLGDGTSLGGQTTNELLTNPSAAVLVMRCAATEWLALRLKGLMRFLDQGGKLEELDPADVRPFKARMAGAERDFAYPLFSIRHLRGGDLRALFEMHSDPRERDTFLKIALE